MIRVEHFGLKRPGLGISLTRMKAGAAGNPRKRGAGLRWLGSFVGLLTIRVEARRVIWGSYRREGQKWVVRAQVLNVASGQVSGELQAASDDWFEVRDNLAGQVLANLGVKPAEAERRKLLRRSTSSPLALEWFSKAYSAQREGKPAPEQEACLREAVAADPQYAHARADG